ncbi:hypothetical protein FIBSPDRAFT_865723 [Athelia psychrophila]|uniref:Uncharacterized protein n=1 Tax=Athelia psychrophila TaxID=1759441 RepID=A0A166F9Q7_9AGAM|nr:hypothetical protein FIBSPDRAFT_865723 [Fibularhizoctonia sp. CBS 109695]
MPVSYRQRLHNYLQTIYRNSHSLRIIVRRVNRTWQASVYIYNELWAQATHTRAAEAREAAAEIALSRHRGW